MSTPTPTHTAVLRSVIKHWNEFGPEHGFDEVIDRAERALASPPAPQGEQRTPAELLRQLDAMGGIGAQAADVIRSLMPWAIQGEQPRTLNDWFLSLPEGRQAVLRDDKWMLADAAFCAGLKAIRDSRPVNGAPCGQPLAQADVQLPGVIEQLAKQWDGRMFGEIDIGKAIRIDGRRFLKDSVAAPVQPHGAPLPPGAIDVLAERRRQVEAEGWTAEHDDEHCDGSLAHAAACYALHAGDQSSIEAMAMPWRNQDLDSTPEAWPASWDAAWWRPKDRRRNLIKAGALILAEIERLDRASPVERGESSSERGAA